MEPVLKRLNKQANCLRRYLASPGVANEVLIATGNLRQLGLVYENIGTLFDENGPERALAQYNCGERLNCILNFHSDIASAVR